MQFHDVAELLVVLHELADARQHGGRDRANLEVIETADLPIGSSA